MRALARSSWLIFATSLPRLLRSRRALLVLLLALVPAVLAWIASKLTGRSSPGEMAVNGGWLLLVQVVTPLAGLILGSAAVAEEVEDRTLTYLFTRPMPRAALLIGRWSAIAVVLIAILAVGTWLFLVAAGGMRGEGPPIDAGVTRPLFTAALAGGLAYSALAASLGAFVKSPIVVGLGYAFAVEGFLANLPGRNQLLTVQHYLRSLIAADGSTSWAKVEGLSTAGFVDGRTAAFTLLGIVVVALVAGCWRLARREFLLSS
ncbi:MAG: ABC transporter permease subunit [Planctomycetota bacterium]|nr:ABC transporter permease subunit [Planctomycetota bacterium]